MAISIGLFYPQLQAPLLAVAFLIAGSRIILGMHFLSDVLAGSAIGAILGVLSFHIFSLSKVLRVSQKSKGIFSLPSSSDLCVQARG